MISYYAYEMFEVKNEMQFNINGQPAYRIWYIAALDMHHACQWALDQGMPNARVRSWVTF